MRELMDRLGWVPKTGVWEITRACGLRCGHCGSSAGSPRPHELGTAECLGLVKDLARLGNRHLTLSGGEPTLRGDWTEIARAARDQGITVNLVTNGQQGARRLGIDARAAGLANVAVSLDGVEPTHDALRAPGTFRRATAAIEELAQAGLWVDVMFTVNRRNLDELAEVFRLAGVLGARGFRVQLGKPMGNQTHRTDLTLAPRHLLRLLPLLGELARSAGPRVHVGDSIGFFSPEERSLRGPLCDQGHWTGCYAGCQAIGIESDGGIKGCLSLQPHAGEPDPFLEGNVRVEPLADIWYRPGAFAYNRSVAAQSLAGECARCSHAALCRGGARCVAYAYTGSFAEDPMCYLSVARSEPHWADRVWPVSAAAAAAALLVGLGSPACAGETEDPDGGTGGAAVGGRGTTGGVAGAGGNTSTGGAPTAGNGGGGGAAPNCESVCCACEYGIIPPDVFKACCCTNVCCMCDYGLPPPAQCCS